MNIDVIKITKNHGICISLVLYILHLNNNSFAYDTITL